MKFGRAYSETKGKVAKQKLATTSPKREIESSLKPSRWALAYSLHLTLLLKCTATSDERKKMKSETKEPGTLFETKPPRVEGAFFINF